MKNLRRYSKEELDLIKFGSNKSSSKFEENYFNNLVDEVRSQNFTEGVKIGAASTKRSYKRTVKNLKRSGYSDSEIVNYLENYSSNEFLEKGKLSRAEMRSNAKIIKFKKVV